MSNEICFKFGCCYHTLSCLDTDALYYCGCNSVMLVVQASNDSSRYVGIKCQLDATEIFIADLIACSTCFGHHYAHHQKLKSIIQWLLPVVFRAVVFKLLVWCGAVGYASGLQDAAQNTTGSNHCIILLSS